MTQGDGGNDGARSERASLSKLFSQCLKLEIPTRLYPILQQHPELLGDHAFQVLSDIEGLAASPDVIRQNRVTAAEVETFRNRITALREVLTSCRKQGLVETFRQWTLISASNASELRSIFDRLNASDFRERVPLWDAALARVDRDDNPATWAMLHASVGWDLLHSDTGDPHATDERAASHLRLALEIYSERADPTEWAQVHYRLASLYYRRVASGMAMDAANAICHAEQASRIFTEVSYPFDWASVQLLLAKVYLGGLDGATRDMERLKKGVHHANAALRVVNRDADQQAWASLQVLLGIGLSELQVGDVGENVESAIGHLSSVAAFYSADSAPTNWLLVQINLAACFCRRVQGDRNKNLRHSIHILEEALQLASKERYPYSWAEIHQNLMAVFMTLDSDVARAIEHGRLALEVFTKSAQPRMWALAQMNLAGCYLKEAHLEEADPNRESILTKTIEHTLLALEVHTREAHPAAWAEHQVRFAVAFALRRADGSSQNFDKTMYHFRQALAVYRPEQFPEDCLRLGRGIGDLMFEAERWHNAAEAFEASAAASQVLYDSALFNRSRTAEIRRAELQHHRLAYALARIGRLREAATALERGRALGMREAFDEYIFGISEIARLDADALRDYEEARSLRLQLAARERPAGGTPPVVLLPDEAHAYVRASGFKALGRLGESIVLDPELLDTFSAVQSDVERMSENDVRHGYLKAQRLRQAALDRIRLIPGFANFQKAPGFEVFAQAVTPEWPLAFLVSTSKGGLALLVSRVKGSKELTVKPIWIENTDHVDVLRSFLDALEKPERLESTLPDVLSRLGETLMDPVVAYLQERRIASVVLIPVGLLGLLPLHAARVRGGERADEQYVIDVLDVTYAVSAQGLLAGRLELERRDRHPQHLCGVGNPQPSPPPLRFGEQELRWVAALFPTDPETTLYTSDATIAGLLKALNKGTHIHLACHYRHDSFKPMESELQLGDGTLALWEVYYRYRQDLRGALSKARLVVLSACRSGMNLTSWPDEAVGMPSAFLQAGVPAIVATLWPVDDLSTALLMSRFYENHLLGDADTDEERMTPARALCRAQCWLRDLSVRRLLDYVRHREVSKKLVNDIEERFGKAEPEYRPFAKSPYDWAPFAAFGI